MTGPRMAQPVTDDRGIYSFTLNTHATPYAPLAAEAETIRVLEELLGWGKYRWVVQVDGVTYFVSGAERPAGRECRDGIGRLG